LTEHKATVDEPIHGGESAPHFLVHQRGDDVGVAVQDVEPGRVTVVYLDGDNAIQIQAIERIPLGHKVCLIDLAEGADVIEYGVRIGLTRASIKQGALVHVHNIRSAKWQQSQ
jgi:(2R)-sulfolactate sulfo-lyase subunit alpha